MQGSCCHCLPRRHCGSCLPPLNRVGSLLRSLTLQKLRRRQDGFTLHVLCPQFCSRCLRWGRGVSPSSGWPQTCCMFEGDLELLTLLHQYYKHAPPRPHVCGAWGLDPVERTPCPSPCTSEQSLLTNFPTNFSGSK